MALTEFYVDPSINANSGTGTSGDPYGDLQYALDQADHPASGGARINIKAGTDEVLTATLDFDTGGTGYFQTNSTQWDNFLVIQGYTTAADDGGIGGIDGDATYAIINEPTLSYFMIRDMHLHNVGNNGICTTSHTCSFVNCEFDGSTSTSANVVNPGNPSLVVGCLFHDINSTVIDLGGGYIHRCRFIDDGTSNTFDTAISVASGAVVSENIIWLDTVAAKGIEYQGNNVITGNSIYQNAAGTQKGIYPRISSVANVWIMNNLVEGFSGAGGVGIDYPTAAHLALEAGNAVEDCTTDYGTPTEDTLAAWDNESLGASPFADGANKDFAPVDTGGVKEGSQPSKIGLFTV